MSDSIPDFILGLMTPEIGIVLSILAVAVVLFVSDKLSPDIVAILMVMALVLSRSLTTGEALAGFGNPTVITIAAIFLVTAGLTNTGVAAWIGRGLVRAAGKNEARLIAVTMSASATLSLVMNNMASVSVFLPGLSLVARETRISASKLLIPLSFGTLLGGMATLFTTVNLLANNALHEKGLAPFSLWDFFRIGSILTLAGIAYMVAVGRKLLPVRDSGNGACATSAPESPAETDSGQAGSGAMPHPGSGSNDGLPGAVHRPEKAPWAIGGMALMLALAGSGLLNIAAASLAGALMIVISGAVRMDEGYRAIEWKAVVMVGGMLSMGTALETSGAAVMLSHSIIRELAPMGNIAVLAGFFVIPMILTQVLSSAATGVLLAPIAMSAAEQLHISVYPVLMAVILGASCCFLTPVSHPANILVMTPGGYRFGDYARTGFPLTAIVFFLSMLLIPVFWPL